VLARLIVESPFLMIIPENSDFPMHHEYEDMGYQVRFLPPERSGEPLRENLPKTMEVDGRPAFVADALRIDFQKQTFDRESIAPDPPIEVILRAINSLTRRMRYVTRAPQVSSVELPYATWRLDYTNDDGTPLPQQVGKVRARWVQRRHFSFVGLSPEVWRHMESLTVDWAPPPWHDLLLDAEDALPKVETAVVLAAVAVEVFIADVLDHLAIHLNAPKSLWSWLTHRGGDFNKGPSTEEQFDFLLHYFVGHSLKEDQALWQSFQHLRTARTTFVHEGLARMTRRGPAVTPAEAADLVSKSRAIVDWVRQWLPSEVQWPDFRLTTRIELGHSISDEASSWWTR
jgi:hypothetical protein